ncbi:MAG: hypothetical protein KC546_02145 [Anaerolineae bacterium]|nr:hypothetical protein [Anaerolineae bacterium]
MSRWSERLYDSDEALDFFTTITDRMERELSYWLSPENVQYHSRWLLEVVSIIEVLILCDRHKRGNEDYVCPEKAVERWHSVFMSVWDGDWEVDEKDEQHRLPYDERAYRDKYRSTVEKLFDYLRDKAGFLGDDLLAQETQIPAIPLPMFSKHKWQNEFGQKKIRTSVLVIDLIKHLEQVVIYYHSSEKWAFAISFGMEEAWAAVDMLGFVCAAYETSPGLYPQTVNAYREMAKQNCNANNEVHGYWDENEPFFRNVSKAYDMLEAVARRYKPNY